MGAESNAKWDGSWKNKFNKWFLLENSSQALNIDASDTNNDEKFINGKDKIKRILHNYW